jgi:hypothetical protein
MSCIYIEIFIIMFEGMNDALRTNLQCPASGFIGLTEPLGRIIWLVWQDSICWDRVETAAREAGRYCNDPSLKAFSVLMLISSSPKPIRTLFSGHFLWTRAGTPEHPSPNYSPPDTAHQRLSIAHHGSWPSRSFSIPNWVHDSTNFSSRSQYHHYRGDLLYDPCYCYAGQLLADRYSTLSPNPLVKCGDC